MKDVESIRNFCIAKKGVTESFPFGGDVLVFKVMDKMFALIPLDAIPKRINLKMNIELVEEYRANFSSILPGYHMNKKMWNTVMIEGDDLPLKELYFMIDHSYEEVVKGLTKKQKMELASLD